MPTVTVPPSPRTLAPAEIAAMRAETCLFLHRQVNGRRFVGARDDEIVLTSIATEALNLVPYMIGNATSGRGSVAAFSGLKILGPTGVGVRVGHHCAGRCTGGRASLRRCERVPTSIRRRTRSKSFSPRSRPPHDSLE